MIEFLAQVDPLSAVVAGLWLFAAGMFPVGLMLGSPCSACCNPCTLCTEGTLPETLTVTFDGLPDKTKGSDLISLGFSSCFGTGAVARVTAPGGGPGTDKGPISSVSLENKGSGYAKIGRVAPTLTITGGSGTGATFAPTLSQSQDSCKVDRWALASVSVTGGTGYQTGDALTITAATGDTTVTAAKADLHVDRAPPTLTLGGTATATVNVSKNAISLDGLTWGVSGVTVTAGGTGYTEGAAATFTLGTNDVQLAAAAGTIRVVHDEPENAIITIRDWWDEPPGTPYPGVPASGAGAVLQPVWSLLPSSQWPAPHKKTYELTGMTVINGGSGYKDYALVEISFPSPADGINQSPAVPDPDALYIDCDVVGTGGVIQQVYVYKWQDVFTPTPAGKVVGSRTDALHSVAATNSGRYYKDSPGSIQVVVENGGEYYREDASAPPYVADVTVTISQAAPSTGTGAELSVTIGQDPSDSSTFGKITAVNIDDGGDGYLAWQWRNTKCCGNYYDGMSVVVKRNAPVPDAQPGGPCTYSHYMCGVGNGGFNPGAVYVQYKGPDEPPIVRLYSETTAGNSDDVASLLCNATFTAGANVTDCGNWSGLEFSADNGATATVSTGGEYDPLFRNPGGFGACHICCKGEESPPQEIEATINDPRTNKTGGDRSGTYVLAAAGPVLVDGFGPNFWYGPGRRWSFGVSGLSINVFVEPCSQQFRATNTPPYRAAVPGEFRPDDQGCDFCHNKCRVWAWVSFGTSLWDCNWFSDKGCDVCEDTPVCTVEGRTFSIGGDCGQMTVTVD